MGRSLKKGPFVNAKLLRTIEEMNAANDKKVVKTWSRPSTIFPQMVGRQKARACIYHGRHGRSQIGRICSYQNLQRPCRR